MNNGYKSKNKEKAFIASIYPAMGVLDFKDNTPDRMFFRAYNVYF